MPRVLAKDIVSITAIAMTVAQSKHTSPQIIQLKNEYLSKTVFAFQLGNPSAEQTEV